MWFARPAFVRPSFTHSPYQPQRKARLLMTLVGALALALALAVSAGGHARAAAPHVDVVKFDQEVGPASAHFLTETIAGAQHDGATALVIEIDTPGGDLESMKQIVQSELASATPIVSYVVPAGGRAASAGAFIALAAPVAAMAPGTRIGAASPVDSSGGNIPSTLDTKIKNDLTAQLRSIQSAYGRNVDDAVKMVTDASSFNDDEALANHLVDLRANSIDDLLTAVDGRNVRLINSKSVQARTAGLPQDEIQPTLADQAQALLADPNVLFLLFIVAAVCIYLELAHPGAIVPGTIGGIALVLFLLSAGSIQPNWAGLALMLLAVVLLAIDVRAPTHGVLTIGALISLAAGALIFFDTGANRTAPTLNPWVLGAVLVGVGLISLVVIRYAIRAQRGPVKTGREGLVGATARVTVTLSPEGRVRLLGEDWAARLASPASSAVEVGQEVRVARVDGLTLIVEPTPTTGNTVEGALTWTL